MSTQKLLQLLREDGWEEKDRKGHIHLVHATKTNKLTVPNHKGDIPKGTLQAILKQAGLK